MKPETAAKLVEELGAIPRFPAWSEPICDQVAAELLAMFETDAEAERVCRLAIRTLAEWGGIPGLRAIRDTERGDTWEPNYPPAAPPVCHLCDDTGVTNASLLADEVEVCSCPSADYEHAARLNRRKAELAAIKSRSRESRPRGKQLAIEHERAERVKRLLEEIGA